MSKIQLKKELTGLSHEQLVELMLNMYSARPDAKAYFEFFLNPDVEKLYNQYSEKIDAEFRRSKYRKSKARISKVKAMVKEFASFDPGAEYVVKLRLKVIFAGAVAIKVFDYTRQLADSMLLFVEDSVKYADKNRVMTMFTDGLTKLIEDNPGLFGGYFGNGIKQLK